MTRYCLAVAALAAAVGSAGCLVKETTHRVYLSPSGSVDWLVLEESVRSDDNDAAKRSNEERAWVDSVAAGTHPIAESLRRLGPEDLSTRLLRPARPYMALTGARFARADRVIGRFFEELGLRGEATFEARGQEATLSVSLDLSSLDDPGPETESPATALLEDLDRYRFVLTDGRFVSATGLDILEKRFPATLQTVPSETLEIGALQLRLTWRVLPVEPARARRSSHIPSLGPLPSTMTRSQSHKPFGSRLVFGYRMARRWRVWRKSDRCRRARGWRRVARLQCGPLSRDERSILNESRFASK